MGLDYQQLPELKVECRKDLKSFSEHVAMASCREGSIAKELKLLFLEKGAGCEAVHKMIVAKHCWFDIQEGCLSRGC